MVSVVHSVAALGDFEQFMITLSQGLAPEDAKRLQEAVTFAWETYGERSLGSGERIWSHALGMAVIIAGLKLDVESRIAAVLFAIPAQDEHGITAIEEKFGKKPLVAEANSKVLRAGYYYGETIEALTPSEKVMRK